MRVCACVLVGVSGGKVKVEIFMGSAAVQATNADSINKLNLSCNYLEPPTWP